MRGQLVDAPGYMLNYAAGAVLIAAIRERIRERARSVPRRRSVVVWLGGAATLPIRPGAAVARRDRAVPRRSDRAGGDPARHGAARRLAWPRGSSTLTSMPSSSRSAGSGTPSSERSSFSSWAAGGNRAAWYSRHPTRRARSAFVPACRSPRRSGAARKPRFFQGSFAHYRDASRGGPCGARGLHPHRGDGLARRGLSRFRRHRTAVSGVAPRHRRADPGRGARPDRPGLQRGDRQQPDDRQAGLGHREAARIDGGAERLGGGVSCRSPAQSATRNRPQDHQPAGRSGAGGCRPGAADDASGARGADRPRRKAPEAPGPRLRWRRAARRPAAALGEPGDDPFARRPGPSPARDPAGAAHVASRRPAPGGGAGGAYRRC